MAEVQSFERSDADAYFAVNPDLLDEKIWSYRQLQHLAKRVGVKANGTRSQLVDRLREWHKTGSTSMGDDDEGDENVPPTSPENGAQNSNFHMIQARRKKSRVRAS